MRFTIPGEYAAHARQVSRLNTTTRADWWRTNLRGDRLRGIGNGTDRPVSVHRERVRFGAWESVALNRVREHVCLERQGEDRHPCTLWTRHQVPHWWPYDPPLDVTPLLEELRGAVKAAALAATGRLTPGTGGSEGPPVSGPENAYKCEGER